MTSCNKEKAWEKPEKHILVGEDKRMRSDSYLDPQQDIQLSASFAGTSEPRMA